MPIIPLLVAVIAGAFGNIFIKLGSKALPETFALNNLNAFLNPTLLFGIFLLVASFPFYSVVLQRVPLTVGFPLITSSSFVLVTIISYFIFKEPLTLTNFLGIFLVIAGLFLVSHR